MCVCVFVSSMCKYYTQQWHFLIPSPPPPPRQVWATIKHYQGAALRVRVGRPSPVPASDMERRRAVIVLQTKVGEGGGREGVAAKGDIICVRVYIVRA